MLYCETMSDTNPFALATAKSLNANDVSSKSGKVLAKVIVEEPFRNDVYSPYKPKETTKLDKKKKK